MKFIILLSALVAVALCAEPVPIVRSNSDGDIDGTFTYGFESGDGTVVEAAGNAEGSIQGRYTFTSPEGDKYEVTYVASADGGFQPQGSHFPVGPETPEHVLRTLEWNKAHPEEDKL